MASQDLLKSKRIKSIYLGEQKARESVQASGGAVYGILFHKACKLDKKRTGGLII